MFEGVLPHSWRKTSIHRAKNTCCAQEDSWLLKAKVMILFVTSVEVKDPGKDDTSDGRRGTVVKGDMWVVKWGVCSVSSRTITKNKHVL